MSRLFYHVAQDTAGNLLFDVQGTMRLAGTGTNATIYGDEALTVILPNPMTNHASFGSFKCFLGAGDYDFYMAKAGYSFETLTGVQGHGGMAQQDASAVAITGGTITNLTSIVAGTGFFTTLGAGITPSYPLDVSGGARFTGGLGIGINPGPYSLHLKWNKAAAHAIVMQPLDSDSGNNNLLFQALGGGTAGGISTTATTTSYTTSSDARLKHAIAPLTGALDVVRALNPVSFLWKSDGTPGRGLLAQEVQDVIPDGVITGERDAVDEEEQIVPQMIDYSKLVPYLIGAVKELTQQVEMLQAQLAEASA